MNWNKLLQSDVKQGILKIGCVPTSDSWILLLADVKSKKSNTQEIYTPPPPPDTVADPTPTPAPKSSLADNASSNVDSAKAKANDTKDAISKKTSGYTSAFTNPLKQTQSTT